MSRPPTPRPSRLFTDPEVERAYGYLNREGGADWMAVKRQTLTSDAEARRVSARLLVRLQAAGHAADPIEATRLMFELIRRLKRDLALARHIRAMLGARRAVGRRA
jgi:hypothetical protein